MRSRTGRAAAGVVLWIALMAVFPSLTGPYYTGLAATIGIMALLAIGLVLVTGYAGQFSLASAAFYGLGAYGSALLTVKAGFPALAALTVSALVSTALAYAIGRPIFRLRGHFLAMGTLALTEIFYLLFNNLDVTGGSSGFGGIQPLTIFGFSFDSLERQFWMVWLVVGAALWGTLRIGHSREGRALRALRGHEAAAAACGVNVAWSKTRVFAGSAFLGSVAGSLYAHQLLYVNPPPFGVMTSIDILAIVVLGGLAGPWGAVVGAIVLEAIRQVIDHTLPQLFGAGSVGAGESLALGLVLVLILVLRPDGITGAIGALVAQVRHRRARGQDVATSEPRPDELRLATSSGRSAATPDAAGRPRPSDEVVLSSSGLTKIFGGVHAVEDVDITLYRQEILAVIGPNGAGKSTLMNLLSGNLTPTRGTVNLLGHDVTGRPAYQVAGRGLARTFQTPSLFHGMNARANVLVGAHLRGGVGLMRSAVPTMAALKEEAQLGAEIDAVMRQLGLQQLAGREATQLSLGQQKLLEVARAVAQRPQVLLLDEPGAGLNRMEKLALSQTLLDLRAEGMSLLLIEHDMEFVMRLADRVHVIDFGKTLKVGTPDVVQNDPQVLKAYLGVEGSADDKEVSDATA
jgi:ABC-type branched-subunit amino acid transport system ATPase component/ABC-type branched-subunit amino acid transport system permease subunit